MSVEQVECRETVCKAVFLAEDAAGQAELGPKWKDYGPSKLQDIGVWDEVEGGFRATVFFMREESGDVLARLRSELIEDVQAEFDWAQIADDPT